MAQAVKKQETCTATIEPPCGLDRDAFDLLVEMMTYRRPHGSKAETRFINRFIMPLKPSVDDFGNLIVTVGDRPKVLWSSHTDTVHRQGGRQDVYITDSGFLYVREDDKHSDCLGADCTTGVWLMIQMIKAGKEGVYVFHRAEEIGCQGSSHMAENNPSFFDGIDYAIAFDRYGTDHVITHQGYGRCCSDEFAQALARKLGGTYKPNDGGVYTDTNEYVGLVAECTNISVGYYDQHTRRETQNVPHLAFLLKALLAMNTDDLPVVREPAENSCDWPETSSWDDYSGLGYTMKSLIQNNADTIAEILTAYGMTADTLADEIFATTGMYPN